MVIKCELCGTEKEYTKHDIYPGTSETVYTTTPCCNQGATQETLEYLEGDLITEVIEHFDVLNDFVKLICKARIDDKEEIELGYQLTSMHSYLKEIEEQLKPSARSVKV